MKKQTKMSRYMLEGPMTLHSHMFCALTPCMNYVTKPDSKIYMTRSQLAWELDCKTVVFGRFRKARSAVSAIPACEARKPDTPVWGVSLHSPSPFLHSLQTFRWNIDHRSRSRKIRLFRSLPESRLLLEKESKKGKREEDFLPPLSSPFHFHFFIFLFISLPFFSFILREEPTPRLDLNINSHYFLPNISF